MVTFFGCRQAYENPVRAKTINVTILAAIMEANCGKGEKSRRHHRSIAGHWGGACQGLP
jgi:hypothetical protein